MQSTDSTQKSKSHGEPERCVCGLFMTTDRSGGLYCKRCAGQAKRKQPARERFWSYVKRGDGCWEWQRGIRGQGYGGFETGGKKVYAHRFAFADTYGPIPDGSFVDHICFNKLCVRPAHLRLVTKKQNNEHLPAKRKNNTSGYRGVTFHKGQQMYAVSVSHYGRRVHGGYFTDAEEAGRVAAALRAQLFTHDDGEQK